LIRPATFIRPFRNPAVSPRVFGGSGRFARQISIEDLLERVRNPTETFRGISAIAEKIPGISNLPIARIRNATANIPRLHAIFGSLPGISNLPIARIRNATANIPRLSAIFGSLPDISNLPNFG
jgi:hypothetical protein